MCRTDRKVHFLCPKCQKVVHGSMMLQTEEKVKKPEMTIEVKCPKCKAPMIDVDNLSIPALQLLHRNGFPTVASCDRYHDGFKDPDYNYSDNREGKYYNGPFVGLNVELTDEEMSALEAAEKVFNKEVGGKFVADIMEYEDYTDDDEEVVLVNIGVNGIDPSEDGVIEANLMVTRLITIWMNVIKDRDLTHKKTDVGAMGTWSTRRSMPKMH